MDRGAWWATVHGVAESDMPEATEHAHTCEVSGDLYSSPACNSCFSLPAFKVFS